MKTRFLLASSCITMVVIFFVGCAGVAFTTAREKNTIDAYDQFLIEYGELIKSEVADIKNIGGKYAGAITAGKFLEHFTKYPWIHLDIAGPAVVNKEDSYRGKGASGVGVRLLYEFFRANASNFLKL